LYLLVKHKATIITTLISAIILLGAFSLELKQQQDVITEVYMELPTQTIEEETKETKTSSKDAGTNKAFNEDEAYKELMKNFKTLSPDDHRRPSKSSEATASKSSKDVTYSVKGYRGDYAINSQAEKTYQEIKEQLQSIKQKEQIAEHSKSRSNVTYSLKDRVLEFYKTPRYLCEAGGKVVVSITVNANGDVIEADYNKASNTANTCLVDYAINYAKAAQFNVSDNATQIGTITFLFKEKS